MSSHPTPTAEWYTFDRTASCIVQWGDRRVTLYRSPTGRSFRVWVDGNEWKPATDNGPADQPSESPTNGSTAAGDPT